MLAIVKSAVYNVPNMAIFNDIRTNILEAEKLRNWRFLAIVGDYSELRVFTLEGILHRITMDALFHDKDAAICSASLSPDATQIAFFMYVKRASESEFRDMGLFTVETATGKLGILTNRLFPFCLSHAHYGSGISWSLDGKHIAFIGKDSRAFAGKELDSLFVKTATTSPQDLNIMDLKSMKIDTPIENGVRTVYAHAWSPDAREIVYVGVKGDIQVYNLVSNYQRKLGDGDLASWSHDGRYIAYKEPGPEGRVVLINPFGQDKRTLCAAKHGWLETVLMEVREPVSSYPLWSPDNRYLLVSCRDSRVNKVTHHILDFQTLKTFSFENNTVFLSWEGNPR
jgi:Tol biopolymer transport system component